MKNSPNRLLPPQEEIHEAIQRASRLFQERGFSEPRIDAEILLAHYLKIRKVDLYLERVRQLNDEERAGYTTLIQRRLRGEPLAQITGKKEFWSLEFTVNRSCLIPRPETEILVEKALEIYRAMVVLPPEPFRILDLGTGSGIIAVCLAREIPNASVVATDISHDALAVAKENAQRHGVSDMIEFLEGNLFSPVSEKESYFDLIVSNPPYIAERDLESLPVDIINFEPYHALYGGDDGLAFYESIIPGAIPFLREPGWIALEIGFGEADRVIGILRDTGAFEDISVRDDFSGIPRIVCGRKAGLA